LLALLLAPACCAASAASNEAAPPDLDAYPWVFCRDGRAPAPAKRSVSVLVVGDVMLGRGVAARPEPLAGAREWLQRADLSLGNLEGVLVEGEASPAEPPGEARPILLRMPPESARVLAEAGFDVLGLANNHALDFGPAGLLETAKRLQRAGVDTIGWGAADGRTAPLVREHDGVRLAFLAFNALPGPDGDSADGAKPVAWDAEAARETIAAARAVANAVIVSVHWGFENDPRPDPAQESIARAMLAAGADLIVGHHPHVAQAVRVHGDRVIAYSLGNFVFDQAGREQMQGLALRAFFDADGLRAAQVLPVRAGPRPRLERFEDAGWMTRILPPPSRSAWACGPRGCFPAAAAQVERSGSFHAGRVDLTGDGETEVVRRRGERITIHSGERMVWESPADWRVVDVALGDPNNDGRREVMLALRRPDADGVEHSQPYIVGYRRGAYRLLWGGRPVAAPIEELAVGDVDGDGADELVVIVSPGGAGSRRVAVWRWSGWSFSLTWNSEPGCYRDLVLLPREGSAPLISAALCESASMPAARNLGCRARARSTGAPGPRSYRCE